MTMQRFVGMNARDTMSKVRDALGDDAVIIKSQRIAGGYEIVAMSDDSMKESIERVSPKIRTSPGPNLAAELRLKEALRLATASKKPPVPEPLKSPVQLVGEGKFSSALDAATEPLPNPFNVDPVDSHRASQATPQRKALGGAAYEQLSTVDSHNQDWPSDEVSVQLSSHGQQMHKEIPPAEPEMEIFEAELVEDVEEITAPPILPSAAERFEDDLKKALAITQWSDQMLGDLNSMQDLIRRQILPRVSQSTVYAELNGLLSKAGFQADLCTQMLSGLPGELSEGRMDKIGLNRWLEHSLVEQISVISRPDLWWGGRAVVALFGTNGVGKSTTIAKLASRFLSENEPSEAVILSLDSDQHETMRSNAQLFNIDFIAVERYQDLKELLKSLSYKRLVMIDTAGYSYRHKKLSEQMSRIAGAAENITGLLVLNAASEAESLEAMTNAYISCARSTGMLLEDCVVTKLDEAVRIGALISTISRHKLRLNYQSSGSDLLDDFERGSALSLVRQAMDLTSAGSDVSAIDCLQDSSKKFDSIRNRLLDNVGEMTQVLSSIRREFKNAGFVEATRSITGISASRKDQPFARILEERKGEEGRSTTTKPELLWVINDYPIESAHFNLIKPQGEPADNQYALGFQQSITS